MIEDDAALRLYNRLGQARANNGNHLSREEWMRITAGQFKAEIQAALNVPKAKRVKGQRDALYDTLAICCGINLAELTKNGGREIGVALADIRSVMENLTPEEIQRRVAIYKKRYTAPGMLTPAAIAKNWAKIGGPPGESSTRAALFDLYQEPTQDWKAALATIYGLEIAEAYFAKGWLNIGTDTRAKCLAVLRQSQPSDADQ